jgi:hypothetical protein
MSARGSAVLAKMADFIGRLRAGIILFNSKSLGMFRRRDKGHDGDPT